MNVAQNARVKRAGDNAGTVAQGTAAPIAPVLARSFRVGAHDPAPMEDAAAFWRMMAQLATILMAVIMFGTFLYFARPLLMPSSRALRYISPG